jgi:predicted RNA methylase
MFYQFYDKWQRVETINNPPTGVRRKGMDNKYTTSAIEHINQQIDLVTAERDQYKAERDGLVTLCEKILKIMEQNNDQFKSDSRGRSYGHLFNEINKIKEG